MTENHGSPGKHAEACGVTDLQAPWTVTETSRGCRIVDASGNLMAKVLHDGDFGLLIAWTIAQAVNERGTG